MVYDKSVLPRRRKPPAKASHFWASRPRKPLPAGLVVGDPGRRSLALDAALRRALNSTSPTYVSPRFPRAAPAPLMEAARKGRPAELSPAAASIRTGQRLGREARR